MHYEVENRGKMIKNPKSNTNLKILHMTIRAYYHFNFFLSSYESSFIWVNLFRKADKDPNKSILQKKESINCMHSFLFISKIT
jgi:hypothetical protein